MDSTSFFTQSDCPAFLEALLALYLVYSLGTNVKLVNEQTHVFPLHTFTGPYFLVISLIVILHGLTPSSFSEHLSLNGDLLHGSHASLCQSIFLVASLVTLAVSQSFLKKKRSFTLRIRSSNSIFFIRPFNHQC